MKILSITTDTQKIRYVCLDGTQAEPSSCAEIKTVKYPNGLSTGGDLCAMSKTIKALLIAEKPDSVTYLESVRGSHGNSQPIRPVVEALVLMACHEAGAPCISVHPNTLRRREAKFESTVSASVEAIFNAGITFRPKDSRDAYLTGWMALPE
jgi:hypothetical protein